MKTRTYSEGDHYRACTAYVLGGSLRQASRDTGIPFETLQDWSKKEWWTEILQKLRAENEQLYIARYHELVTIGTEKIKERMVEGDPYVTKTGIVKFKPCTLRDICGATMYIFDRLKVLRNLSPNTMKDELDPMKESFDEFKKIALELQGKNKIETPVIDLNQIDLFPPSEALENVHS